MEMIWVFLAGFLIGSFSGVIITAVVAAKQYEDDL